MFIHLMTDRGAMRGIGSRILIIIGAGTAGSWLGAGYLAAAVSSAQDPTSEFVTAEAAAAAAGAFVVFAGIGAIIYSWIMYTGLVRLRNEMDRGFTNIDVLLKQLFDALPNLASVCTPYMQQESRQLLDLARSRNEWSVAQTNEDKWKVGADALFTLKQLFAMSETYPGLRVIEGFAGLQETITEIAVQIAVRREHYNAAAGAFNARIKQFPNAWVADFAGFKSRPLFAAPAQEWMPAPPKFTRLPRA
jgi:LemA protein